MGKKGKVALTICGSVLGILAISGLFWHGHNMEKVTMAQAQRMNTHVQSEKRYDNTQHSKVRQQLFGHALTSKDPTIKSIAINNNDNTIIHKPFLDFFNTFYNWKNHHDYVQRPKLLRNIATKNVLSNKRYFDNDRDSSNGSIINNEQLNSEFNDMDLYIVGHKKTTITVLADVQYNAWHTETDNQATGEKWFMMNYDTHQKKITSMKDIYRQSNVKNDNT